MECDGFETPPHREVARSAHLGATVGLPQGRFQTLFSSSPPKAERTSLSLRRSVRGNHRRSPGLDRGVGLRLGPCTVTGGNRCRTDAAPATVTGTTPTSPLDYKIWEGWGEDDWKPGYFRDERTKTSGGGVGGSHGENHPHPEGISGEIK